MTESQQSTTAAAQWTRELNEIITEFVLERPIAAATVQITLAGGRSFYALEMKAGPGPLHITIDLYPEDNADLIDSERGLGKSPQRLVVPLASIAQVEILADSPEEKTIGFRT